MGAPSASSPEAHGSLTCARARRMARPPCGAWMATGLPRSVGDYAWAGGGLRYAVADEGGRVQSIHHTAGGDAPMFVPDPDEDQVDWVESSDGDLLVLRTQRFGGTGRLCAFDVSDPSWLELGCREYYGENIFVAVATDPDAP